MGSLERPLGRTQPRGSKSDRSVFWIEIGWDIFSFGGARTSHNDFPPKSPRLLGAVGGLDGFQQEGLGWAAARRGGAGPWEGRPSFGLGGGVFQLGGEHARFDMAPMEQVCVFPRFHAFLR